MGGHGHARDDAGAAGEARAASGQGIRAIGISLVRRIMDGTDDQTIGLIEMVAAAVPGVEHVTAARARLAGHGLNAELDIDVDPGISVERGHAIAEDVRHALLGEVPRLRMVTVHVDPHDHHPQQPTSRRLEG